MKALKTFMNEHRTDNKDCTFLSLRGGKFLVPREKAEEFLELYCASLEDHTCETCMSLVWRPPHDYWKPMIFDFDFKKKDNTPLSDAILIEIAEHACSALQEVTKSQSFAVILTKRAEPYQAFDKKKKLTIFKSGMHMYVLGMLVSQKVAQLTRRKLIERLEPILSQCELLNTVDDVVDDKVTPVGKNGVVMCNSFKPGVKIPYHIFMRASYDGDLTDISRFDASDTPKLLREMRNCMYDFIWKCPDWEKFPNEIPPLEEEEEKTPPKPKVREPTTSACKFNIPEFLHVTEGSIPGNDAYKQIIFYACSCGCDRSDMNLFNKAWTPDDPNESFRLFDLYRPMNVTHRSVIRWLNANATKQYDLDKIFDGHFEFYDECAQFLPAKKIVWDFDIVAQYVKDTFCFINSAQKFVYKDRYELFDSKGNIIHQVSTFLRDKMPFCCQDAMQVLLKRTLPELLEMFEKVKPLKNPQKPAALEYNLKLVKLRDALPAMGKAEQIQALKEFLDPPPKKRPLGKIVASLFEDGYIKRYANIRFVPYLHKNPVHPRTFNSFTPFRLLSYKPRRKVDFRKTHIWLWLWECYAFENAKTMRWYTFLLAFIIQHPGIRTNRIFVILSTAMGNGKSSFYHFLMGILDEDKAAFWDDLKKFQDPFDFPTAMKLVNFCDHVSSASPKECQALNSRCP